MEKELLRLLKHKESKETYERFYKRNQSERDDFFSAAHIFY